MLDWETRAVEVAVPIFDEVNEDMQFAGLYGYNMSFINCGFVGESDRFYLITSEFKSQERLYLVDVVQKQVKFIDFLQLSDKREGNYALLNLTDHVAIVAHSSL